MTNEVELKLSLEKKYASRLGKQAVIIEAGIGKPATHKLTNIYFDTPDLKLLDAGITLRLRHQSNSWIQTIKLTGSTIAGLHDRPEWEYLVASNQPDFTKITDKKLIAFFADRKLRDALAPIFQTEVQRTLWKLAFKNGDEVELALDSGVLLSSSNREPISEIELELKAGNTGRLFELALELQSALPLTIENASKAQRGYAYYRAQPAKVYKASLISLDNSMQAHAAFKHIARECITHLQSNQDIVIAELHEEGIHQMRVALRRLRSVFALFKKTLGFKNSKHLLNDLSWLARLLGKARDLDVFIAQTLPSISAYYLSEHAEPHQGLLILEKKALEAQQQAHGEVREMLLSQRYQRLLLSLLSLVEHAPWLQHGKRLPLNAMASNALSKLHQRLLSHHGHFANMQAEERHRIRIAGKKLRYAAEFFASLYSAKSSRKYIKTLTELQDLLGQFNDINVTCSLIRTLSGPRPNGQLKEALQVFEAWNERLTIQNMIKTDQVWINLSVIKPFWM